MSHYDEEIAQAAYELRMKERIRDGSVATVTTCDDFIDDDLYNIHPVVDQEKKQTIGKAEGARYCYLRDIAFAFDVDIKYCTIADNLADMVDNYDKQLYETMLCDIVATLEYIKESFDVYEDLVSLRYNAIKSGKYKINSYREPLDINLLLDASARHLLKIVLKSDIDEESGKSHVSHITANLIMIYAQLEHHLNED